MKKALWLITLLMVLAACKSDMPQQINKTKENFRLTNHLDTVSYSLGINIGKELKKNGVDRLNYNALTYAIYQTMKNIPDDSLLIHPEVAQNILKLYFYYEKKSNKQTKTQTTSNWKDFFARNKQKKEVKELNDGIQYIVLEKGNGPKVNKDNYVTITYTGYKTNGKPFDQRYSDKPVTVKVSSTLQGWQIALTKMRKGDKWRIFLAPQYAFGQKQIKDLSPNSVVIYDIKIHDVKRLK